METTNVPSDQEIARREKAAQARAAPSAPRRIPTAEALAAVSAAVHRQAKREQRPTEKWTPPPWGHSDIPGRYRRWRLRDFGPAAERIREFLVTDDYPGCYLWGETGGRKTSLAAAALIEARGNRPDRWGDFVTPYCATRTIRAVTDPAMNTVLRTWGATPFLVLDDLGKHRDTPHVIEQLLFLLHERYDWPERAQKTIVTANMDLDELAERIDPGTARRLGEGLVIELTCKEI